MTLRAEFTVLPRQVFNLLFLPRVCIQFVINPFYASNHMCHYKVHYNLVVYVSFKTSHYKGSADVFIYKTEAVAFISDVCKAVNDDKCTPVTAAKFYILVQ